MIYSVYIVNKAGSLLLSRDYALSSSLSANDRMLLLSTFHRCECCHFIIYLRI